ncbi:MAG: hypothetical protein EAZ58_08730 [Flavobacterium sp.]|nr:MAG: hypothetical protein EAZ58_08730 [Flavobacterium sp.]
MRIGKSFFQFLFKLSSFDIRQLSVISYGFSVMSYELSVMSYEWSVMGFLFCVVSYELSIMGCRLWVFNLL